MIVKDHPHPSLRSGEVRRSYYFKTLPGVPNDLAAAEMDFPGFDR
jgi:hypothetical protein